MAANNPLPASEPSIGYTRRLYDLIASKRLPLPLPKSEIDGMLSKMRRRLNENENPSNSNQVPNVPSPTIGGPPFTLEVKLQYGRDLHDLITSNQLILPLEKPILGHMLYCIRHFINTNSSNSSSILRNSNLVDNRTVSLPPLNNQSISIPPVVNRSISNPPVVNPNNVNTPVVNPNPVINPNIPPNYSPVVNPNNPNPPVVNANIPPMVNPNPMVNHLAVYQNLLNSIANCGNPFNSNQILSNIYEINPEELADDYGMNPKKEWFFFTLRGRKYKDESILNRVVGDGYWELVIGADETIKQNGETLGFRKTFQFYKGKHPNGDETSWIMHEFRVTNPLPGDTKSDDWVLCKIYNNEKTLGDYRPEVCNVRCNAINRDSRILKRSRKHRPQNPCNFYNRFELFFLSAGAFASPISFCCVNGAVIDSPTPFSVVEVMTAG
ncbi:NAC domain-containing protein [Abeliophyllum distichum]|uniref:NAC domain-containing protein n=1 Tax=Abeliophyllum distichum TaxID=126358 RepID=A0ABD1NWH3_9LAMI